MMHLSIGIFDYQSIKLGFQRSCSFQYGGQWVVKPGEQKLWGATTTICKQDVKITTLFTMCPWPLTQTWVVVMTTDKYGGDKCLALVFFGLLWVSGGEAGNKRGRRREDALWSVDKNVWRLSSRKESFFPHSLIALALFLPSLPKQTGLSVGSNDEHLQTEAFKRDWKPVTRKLHNREANLDLSSFMISRSRWTVRVCVSVGVCVCLQGGRSWKGEEREAANHSPPPRQPPAPHTVS